MDSKPWLILLLLALTMMVASEASTIHEFGREMVTQGDIDLITDDNEFLMSSESIRRTLQGRRRYIGYNSMRANQVPCGNRGRSYYNCQQRGRANPYRRGCTKITNCARNVN
ncbi:PREDICTED: protein RALF-like 19 [Lupinus angustifolius]|uniref:protein RALF-like 19 n=1 Tax=Lupinus angustifolius TaxID=3871 RepID=UPI00092F2A09|nr:PREDICTED: protein RALF-like 19 [Lupinus angustifolius]